MISRYFRIAVSFAILSCATVATVVAQSQEDVVRKLLIDRDREIKAVLVHAPLSDTEEEALRDIVNGLILFEEMGRTALGNHWDKLSALERADFVETFSAIVREQSLADLDPYRAVMTIESVKVEQETGHASTIAVYKDVSTLVEYDLLRRNGVWWITDISLDGVSTAEGYARSFQSAIRKRGFEGLMISLRKRLARISG